MTKVSTKIKNAIDAGMFKAFGCQVTPRREQDQIVFLIRGDVDEALQKIASNVPIGSRDVLEAIKATRSMIFMMREGQR